MVEIEEADGSSSRQTEDDFSVLTHELRRNFPPWPHSTGQKEFGPENGITNKKKGSCAFSREWLDQSGCMSTTRELLTD